MKRIFQAFIFLFIILLSVTSFATTRAIQIDFLLTGIVNPNSNAPLSGGTIDFYSAGTSTPKNVWTEVEKTNPYTQITLGSDGTAQVYGDGFYKLVVKNSAGTTIYTWDNIIIQATTFTTLTKTANYTVTPDVDWVLCDTDGGAFTISLQTAANYNRSITVKNIGSSGNDVTIDPYSTETVDGASTATIADGNAQTYATDGTEWYSSATHASTHERSGADEIDGDHLDVDWDPSNYTPATTPTEAANADDLTAHLYGIDDFLGTDHTTLLAHHARHERAGSDEIDGDHLDIDYNPSTYVPSTTPSEAANVDDLTAHLYGINQHLSVLVTGYTITALTANDTWTSADTLSYSKYSNYNSGGSVTITLPSSAGLKMFEVFITDAQYLRFNAGSGSDTFRYLDGVSAEGGYIRSNTVGTHFKCFYIYEQACWYITDLVGELLVDE